MVLVLFQQKHIIASRWTASVRQIHSTLEVAADFFKVFSSYNQLVIYVNCKSIHIEMSMMILWNKLRSFHFNLGTEIYTQKLFFSRLWLKPPRRNHISKNFLYYVITKRILNNVISTDIFLNSDFHKCRKKNQ